MKQFASLFKKNTNGSIQSWEIYYNEDSYWTISGQVDGKKVESKPTLVKPKSNRSLSEQIELELNSKVKSKTDKGYVTSIDKVDNVDLPAFTPMLAKKWEDQKSKITYPCIVQPKLDGLRCLSDKNGLYYRSRKPIESCRHITDALSAFYKDDENAQLDGELYTHEYKDDFEVIVGAVKKTKKHETVEDIRLQEKIKYYIYDTPRINKLKAKDSFTERYKKLSSNALLQNKSNIVIVESKVANNEKELVKIKEQYVEDGYEGAMIRNINMPYEFKRSAQLLKFKDFIDEEFEIIGIEEGKGNLAGHAARFTLVNKDKQEFGGKLVGSFERLQWIFNNPQEVIGKMATVRYQNLTGAGIPRFPVVKAIRGLKDRSDWI